MSESMTFTWEHVLYRLYDREGALLYVGITNNVRSRFRAHLSDQPWWPEVSDCRTEFLPSREALEEAEVVTIQTEKPRYNIRHNTPPKRRTSQKPELPSSTELRADGFTPDEWAWIHCLPPYDRPQTMGACRTPPGATTADRWMPSGWTTDTGDPPTWLYRPEREHLATDEQ